MTATLSSAQSTDAAVDTVPIIDVDSHVAEPVDLWSSRLPSKYQDRAPSVAWDEAADDFRWKVGGVWLSAVGEYCTAGWREPFPSHPPTLEEADHATWDPAVRLQRMDEYGIQAQILYPNLIAFDTHTFLHELGPEMATECVRVYNDFLAEFAQADPKRLVPLMVLPFWDVEESIKELHRAHSIGHRGVLFAALLKRIGMAGIGNEQWTPLLSEVEEMGLSINYHIGFGVRSKESSEAGHAKLTKSALEARTNRRAFVRQTALSHSSSVEAAADTILRGVCKRHPNLTFVSVESGFGYWPYALDQMDWFWHSSGAAKEFKDDLLPSEYWRRNFLCTFWYERSSVALLPDFEDNVMFETDFPHESALAPGLGCATSARETVRQNLSELPVQTLEKVLYSNAARLYGIE